jgi:inner membrane protein
MDNLTHSLIGAVMGQAGLKRRTGLSMPALIIGANLPDIDAACALYGTESLAMRRGITHGPIALLVLPLLLAGALLAFDRWQARRGTRPAERLDVRPGWLLALCYIGALTHPAFDWLNNYGIRLLEPFSSEWFYGDALFIIDPIVLVMLAAGVWFSLRRERARALRWERPARAAIVGVLAYVALNIGISLHAESLGRSMLMDGRRFRQPLGPEVLVVANTVPLAFWKREILWRDERHYGSGAYNAFRFQVEFPSRNMMVVGCSASQDCHSPLPKLEMSRINLNILDGTQPGPDDPAVRSFLFWSRMPVVKSGNGGYVLNDQRFANLGLTGNFGVELRSD